MKYNFEWDIDKAEQNKRKHKISFQRAAKVFRDPNMISIFDEEHSEIEERWITTGIDENGILLVVSHTFKKISESLRTIRIISSRKATKNEKKQYREIGL